MGIVFHLFDVLLLDLTHKLSAMEQVGAQLGRYLTGDGVKLIIRGLAKGAPGRGEEGGECAIDKSCRDSKSPSRLAPRRTQKLQASGARTKRRNNQETRR